MKSKELEEKAKKAERLEELHRKAVDADMIIDDLLYELNSVDIQEPHGWLSSIVSDLVTEIETQLERL